MSAKPSCNRPGMVIAATASTARACGMCCVVPVVVPVFALGSFGAVLAWFEQARGWITWIAALAVASGWIWIAVLVFKSRAKVGPATIGWMGSATLIFVAAWCWSSLEPSVLRLFAS